MTVPTWMDSSLNNGVELWELGGRWQGTASAAKGFENASYLKDNEQDCHQQGASVSPVCNSFKVKRAAGSASTAWMNYGVVYTVVT